MVPELNGANQATYNAIFQHPMPRDLAWKDVRALLGALADVVEGGDGNLKLTRNGRKAILQRPRRNVAEVQVLMDIRRFLTEPTI